MKLLLVFVLLFCSGILSAQHFEFLKNYEVGNKLVYDYNYYEFDQYAYQDSSIILTSFNGEKTITVDEIVKYKEDSLVYFLSIEKNGMEVKKTAFEKISEKVVNRISTEKLVVDLNYDQLRAENHLSGWIFPDSLYQTREALAKYPYYNLYNLYSADDTSLTINQDSLEIEYLSKYVNYNDSYFSVKYILTIENGLVQYSRKYDYYRSGFEEKMILKKILTVESNLDFYPLDNGNYWEYEVMNGPNPYGSFEPLYSVFVKGDTTLNNGIGYKILEKKFFSSSGYSYTYERIDSLDGSVYRFDADNNMEYKIDSLFANPGDTIAASNFGSYGTIGGIVCREIKYYDLFGAPFIAKEFEDNSSVPGKIYRLAKGLGRIYDWTYESNFWIERLTYAKIKDREYGEIVGVKDIEDNAITDFKLHQNYPNPFNPVTTIEFDLPYSTEVKLKIYNSLGEEVKTLIDEYKDAGNHRIEFNAENLSSGVYIYRLTAGSQKFAGKMNLLK